MDQRVDEGGDGDQQRPARTGAVRRSVGRFRLNGHLNGKKKGTKLHLLASIQYTCFGYSNEFNQVGLNLTKLHKICSLC